MLTEPNRNELLRRVDWRFLLSRPRPSKVICFSAGVLADALQLVSDSVILANAHTSTVGCDLAVAVDPDLATLQAAWDALRPGGELYVEWQSYEIATRSSSRLLRRIGFADIRSYWPHPHPARGAVGTWVPLDGPGLRFGLKRELGVRPLGFYLRAIARSAADRFLRPNVRWMLSTTAKKPAPSTPTTRVIPSAQNGHGGLQQEVFETLRDRWNEWFPGAPPQMFSWMLMTGGTHSSNKVVAAVFTDSQPIPPVVVKLARTPEGAIGAAREAANLSALQANHQKSALGPRLLFCETHAGVLTVAETFVGGRPMSASLTRSTFRESASRATARLVTLAARRGAPPKRATWARTLDGVLADFEVSFGPALDDAGLDRTRALLTDLPPLPVVFEHRDYSPTNIVLTSDTELGVLDWESAERDGVPYLDLIYFLTHAALIVDDAWTSGSLQESYRALWHEDSDLHAIAYDCLESYERNTGIAHGPHLPGLRLLSWLVHSRSEFKRLVGRYGTAPEPAQLRQSVFVSLWEEELRWHDATATRQRARA